MDVELIFKIAAVGILVAVLNVNVMLVILLCAVLGLVSSRMAERRAAR